MPEKVRKQFTKKYAVNVPFEKKAPKKVVATQAVDDEYTATELNDMSVEDLTKLAKKLGVNVAMIKPAAKTAPKKTASKTAPKKTTSKKATTKHATEDETVDVASMGYTAADLDNMSVEELTELANKLNIDITVLKHIVNREAKRDAEAAKAKSSHKKVNNEPESDDDIGYTAAELNEMTPSELAKLARKLGVNAPVMEDAPKQSSKHATIATGNKTKNAPKIYEEDDDLSSVDSEEYVTTEDDDEESVIVPGKPSKRAQAPTTHIYTEAALKKLDINQLREIVSDLEIPKPAREIRSSYIEAILAAQGQPAAAAKPPMQIYSQADLDNMSLDDLKKLAAEHKLVVAKNASITDYRHTLLTHYYETTLRELTPSELADLARQRGLKLPANTNTETYIAKLLVLQEMHDAELVEQKKATKTSKVVPKENVMHMDFSAQQTPAGANKTKPAAAATQVQKPVIKPTAAVPAQVQKPVAKPVSTTQVQKPVTKPTNTTQVQKPTTSADTYETQVLDFTKPADMSKRTTGWKNTAQVGGQTTVARELMLPH